MDATKQKRPLRLASTMTRSIMTRSRSGASNTKTDISKLPFTKRKAESPIKVTTKKSVFRDLTNKETVKETTLGKFHEDSIAATAKKLASTNLHDQTAKKDTHIIRKVNVTSKARNEGTINAYFKTTKQATRIASQGLEVKKEGKVKVEETKHKTSLTAWGHSIKPSIPRAKVEHLIKSKPELLRVKGQEKENVKTVKPQKETEVGASSRINSGSSQEGDSPSLYVTALEDLSSASNDRSAVFDSPGADLYVPPPKVLPEGVTDFDAENWDDPFQVSHYATDIFNYFKTMEKKYQIRDYMPAQSDLTTGMRAIVVDWMVELQENFALNHETLYLAVKLVDSYMSRVTVKKNTLQLVAAASVFIASKYDERFPPSIEDTLYVCEGAYTKDQLLDMEFNILKTIDYNLGFPISYRYLRRYARYGKVSMPTLTLARYILEYSLMDYSFLSESDSKIAASSLLLALKMKGTHDWSPNLEYSSGYNLEDLKDTTRRLNFMLQKVANVTKLEAVKNKYSHKIFFEVTKIPLINILTF